jgi:hydroxymethylpyrimidine pyrophosphatase-like HAD family hydrolase
MAIGDNYNDVEMLNYAGQPVLMGNAPQELRSMAKSCGWSITATNDQDGVALSILGALQRNEALGAVRDAQELVGPAMVEFPG